MRLIYISLIAIFLFSSCSNNALEVPKVEGNLSKIPEKNNTKDLNLTNQIIELADKCSKLSISNKFKR